MDFGKNFYDGKRIFGNNKTFRGFFFGLAIGILVGSIECVLFGFPILFSMLDSFRGTFRRFGRCFFKEKVRDCSRRFTSYS